MIWSNFWWIAQHWTLLLFSLLSPFLPFLLFSPFSLLVAGFVVVLIMMKLWAAPHAGGKWLLMPATTLHVQIEFPLLYISEENIQLYSPIISKSGEIFAAGAQNSESCLHFKAEDSCVCATFPSEILHICCNFCLKSWSEPFLVVFSWSRASSLSRSDVCLVCELTDRPDETLREHSAFNPALVFSLIVSRKNIPSCGTAAHISALLLWQIAQRRY